MSTNILSIHLQWNKNELWMLRKFCQSLLKCHLPAGLWARMGVACAVGLWPRQRCTKIVRVGLIINGAEDQTRLVA